VPLRNIGLIAFVAQLGLAALGCDDLHQFKTTQGTVFRGEVVGSDSDPAQSSFIRTGFSSHTHMELEFDPDATGVNAELDATMGQGAPGRVHTFTCAKRGCSSDSGTAGPFDHARLEPPENGAAIQRNAMLFLSLMETGKVEVRAISPSVLASDGQTERLPALFGVFVLDRQSR
jgi:hypothetical protein